MATTYRLVQTDLGWCGFVMSPRGLRGVETPQKSAAAARRLIRQRHPQAEENPRLAARFAGQLQAYFRGEATTFDVSLDLHEHTAFQRRVWQACEQVAYGTTSSYRDLARAVGKPQAARAVGMAMKRNPVPIVIPCHRICRHDGSLGGYSGAGGLNLKRRLLAMEARAGEGS